MDKKALQSLLTAVHKAHEKAQIYQLLINYLGELSDGVSSPDQEVSFLSREAIQEVIVELCVVKEGLSLEAVTTPELFESLQHKVEPKAPPPKKPPVGKPKKPVPKRAPNGKIPPTKKEISKVPAKKKPAPHLMRTSQ